MWSKRQSHFGLSVVGSNATRLGPGPAARRLDVGVDSTQGEFCNGFGSEVGCSLSFDLQTANINPASKTDLGSYGLNASQSK